MKTEIIIGDCLDVLKGLPDESVNCCVTSPPYFNLRDYGIDGQIGLEKDPAAYIETLVRVFGEVQRVLRRDGTLWLNLGDSYAEKDLLGIPWRVAFALQADGWYLRSDIVWSKPNAMPESVKDRPTRSHEFCFLLSRSEKYFYDSEAVREKSVSTHPSGNGFVRDAQISKGGPGQDEIWQPTELRNMRDVVTINNNSYPEAHFATMPTELAEICIKAGSREGDLILDPFGGAGTTGLCADRLQRNSLLIELNPEYAALAERRIKGDAPLFAEVAVK